MKKRIIIITALLLSLVLEISFASSRGQLDKAYELLHSGKGEPAIAIADDVLKLDPKNPDARFIKGMALARTGKNEQAIVIFKSLVRDYPNNPEPYNNLAALYALQGKYHEARDALLAAINTHPSYATAYENLGNIYSKMAIVAYNRALELDKDKKPEQVDVQLAFINRFSDATGKSVTVATPVVTAPVVAAPVVKPEPTKAKTEVSIAEKSTSVDTGSSIFSYDEEKNRILATIYAWSQAWSSQKPEDYLSYYAPDFEIPQNMSRSEWEALRHDRLKKPRFIRVQVEKPTISFVDDKTVRLSFLQDYHSDSIKDKIRKTLIMRKVNGNWRILRETSGS